MFDTRFYISLLDFYNFDRECYVIGQNENMLRIKVKEYTNYNDHRLHNIKIKYRNYWADHILQRERQSVTYVKVSEGIIDSMIHGLDNIIIACGSLCSGKTFNIIGSNHKYEGIAPRLIQEMLSVKNDQVHGVLAMSCVEIKNNLIFDLLSNDDSKKPCLMKNVFKYQIDLSSNAKRKLRKANSKRTVLRDNNKTTTPSHVYDFIITFYWRALPTDSSETELKTAKIHILELAGIGPNTSRPIKNLIQANRTILEFVQFFERVTYLNTNDNCNTMKDFGCPTSTLMKYCYGSFSKKCTTLRVMCHIRPEPEFLTTNISVLKLGEALRKLPNTIVNVPTLEPESIEIHKQMEHYIHELHIYGIMKDQRSMMDMTDERYERLRKKVLDFLHSKSDDIVLLNWNYVDVFTILSVFREYYEISILDENKEQSNNQVEFEPFHLKSQMIDKNLIRKIAEDVRHAVNEAIEPLNLHGESTGFYWNSFTAENSVDLLELENIAANIRKSQRSFEISLGIMLETEEKLFKMRDRMDKLRRKRHLNGNEKYDKHHNVIVPAEEQSVFRNLQETDTEMMTCNHNFSQAHINLNSILADHSKLKDAMQNRYEEYCSHLSNEHIIEDAPAPAVDANKGSAKNMKKNSPKGLNQKTKSGKKKKVKEDN